MTVGDSLLRQIVVNDESVLAVVTEPLAHGTAGEGSKVLKGSGFRCGSGDNDRVLHRIVLLESFDELRHSRALQSDSDVNTVKLLALVGTIVPLLLVENSVDCDGRLACLTISDDELTLATTNLGDCQFSTGRPLGRTGTSESTLFNPVCIGSCTLRLGNIPGALS